MPPLVHNPTESARAALERIKAREDLSGIAYLERDVRHIIADRKAMHERLVTDGIDPEALIYLIVANLAFDALCTGQHHIYRGVLSMTGSALHAAYGVAATRLLAAGIYDRATHDENVALLRKKIKDIG